MPALRGYLSRTARRGFGIDHPVMGEQHAVALLPSGGVRFGIIRSLACAPGRFECGEKLATEYARGRLYRKEEAAATARGLPLPRLIKPAAGDVKVRAQVLCPRVQDQTQGRGSAEPARVGGQFEQGCGGTAEQGVEESAWVTGAQGFEFMRQREHPVGVGHGQQLAQPCAAPRLLGPGLALWAMTVTTRAPDMTLGAAGIAAFAHPAQRRSSALDNGAPRARLCRRQRVGAPVRCARAQDSSQRWPLHGQSSSEPMQQVEWTVLRDGTGAS